MYNKLIEFCQNHWDLTAHTLIECIIVKLLKYIFCWWFAIIIGIVTGLYKEYKIDKQVNIDDLSADLIGIILGIL